MKTYILSGLFALVFLAQTVLGDLSVEVTPKKVVTGLKNPSVVQGVVLFDEGSEVKVSSAAHVVVKTDFKFVRVKARQTLFEAANVVKLTDTDYILVGSGKYALEVTAFDPEKGIDEKVVQVDLGEPQPGPDNPTPGPDNPNPPNPGPIPDDEFGNLGKRVFEWSKNLPKKKEVAALYREAAKSLSENPSVTINSASQVLADSRAKVLGTDLDKYNKFIEEVNKDLKSRWPLQRLDFTKYLTAIAVGLEG